MTPEEWRDLENLYDAVRDLPEEQTSEVLGRADPQLREHLVKIMQQDGSLLDQPAWVGRKDLIVGATVGPGTELGPYKLEALIGTGGMGEVYRAIDTRLGRTVAIKLLLWEVTTDPAYRNRLLREARAVSGLNHPNIVVLYDISCHEGADFLVMEYLAGTSLKDLIPPEGLPLEQVVNIGLQAVSALAAAHAAGIVHRDVKPANIVVTGRQLVKVLDFGIAKLPRDGTVSDLTNGGQVMGTVTYMSPEQTRGEEADFSSDIFSLGCVLHEATTGRSPFTGTSVLAMIHEIASAAPPAPSTFRPDIPPWFDALIAKCLRKERGERFRSMAELGEALQGGWSYPGQVAQATSPRGSIAVLPFVSGDGNADGDHFGEGLAEELIGALSVLPQLRVTSRSSAFSFRGKGITACEIGRRLNVENVLEGSFRRSGQRLRINAQLIQSSDGNAIWSERFDRELTDIFDLQDEITATVVSRLRGRFVDLPATLLKKRFTDDPEAYTLFLKGRHYWGKRPAGTYAAIECFQKALERDPKYALAYASLADCYNTLGSWEAGILAPEEAHSRGRAYAERALQLDPNLAEGHTALGYGLLHFAWDLGAAERSMQEAIRSNPAYSAAHHWYSHVLIAARRFEESREESLLYLKNDPADAKAVSHFCWHRLMAHDFSEAELQSRAATVQEPGFGWHHVYLGWALMALDRREEALRAMQDGAAIDSGVTVFQNFATHARAVAGERDQALAELSNLEHISADQYVSPYEIGLIYEALGNRVEAFRHFEKAFAQRSPWLVYLANESRLTHLRGQPEFDSLVNRVNRVLHRTSENTTKT